MSYFQPYLGKIPILANIFSSGLVQPPTSHFRCQHPRKTNIFSTPKVGGLRRCFFSDGYEVPAINFQGVDFVCRTKPLGPLP